MNKKADARMPMPSYGNTNFAFIPTESIDFPKEPREKNRPWFGQNGPMKICSKSMVWNVKT
jgi:hypothetical protein